MPVLYKKFRQLEIILISPLWLSFAFDLQPIKPNKLHKILKSCAAYESQQFLKQQSAKLHFDPFQAKNMQNADKLAGLCRNAKQLYLVKVYFIWQLHFHST